MFRSLLLVTILGGLVSWAIGGETINESLNHGGRTRTYHVYVPDAYTGDEPWPLVLNLHGTNLNSSIQAELSQMNPVADRENFLVAYPKSASNRWNTLQLDNQADDLGFISVMLDAIATGYSIDHSRVYSTGYSNGGSMSFLLAHELEDRIAAIAPVNGPISILDSADNVGPIDPTVAPTSSRAVPLMYFSGTSDALVQYGGGVSRVTGDLYPPTEDVVGAWVENNRCDTVPSVSSLPDTDTTDRSTVELIEYTGCESYVRSNGGMEVDADVVLYKVIGGGHRWPGGREPPPIDHPALAPTNHDINASQVIWEFFSQHTLPQRSVAAVCDFDGSASCDLGDIDAMIVAIFQGSPDLRFDLNGDRSIDQSDIAPWLASAATENGFAEPHPLGDADLDGTVDSGDLNNLGLNWQQEVALWSGGDFNADGSVNSADLNELGLNWQATIPLASSARSTVPEPSAWLLMLFGLSLVWRRPRNLL